jgi:hypothetical protein
MNFFHRWRENWDLKLIALTLAIALWYYVRFFA